MHLARLGHHHTGWLRTLINADPVQYTFIHSLLELAKTAEVATPAGTLYGVFDATQPVAAYWAGGNIIPVGATPETNAVFATMLNSRGRYSCSVMGDAAPVLDLAGRLAWGKPRGVRTSQPLLALDREPDIASDPEVVPALAIEVPAVFASSVAMFTEEVGFSPVENGAQGYYNRVRNLVAAGHCLTRMTATGPDGAVIRKWPARDTPRQVLFKADIGIRSSISSQVQGVWVHPDFRGRGVAAPGMAATVRYIRQRFSPLVSLYANDFNTPALRTYARVGFEQVGTFASVLF